MSAILAYVEPFVNPADLPSWDEPGVSLHPDDAEDRADRDTLADAIEREVARYRALDTSLGHLLADHIAELAVLAGLTGATDPEQLRDRADAYTVGQGR